MNQENKSNEGVPKTALLSISLIISALIVSGSIFVVGEEINSKIDGLATLISETPTGTPESESADNKINPAPEPKQEKPSAGLKTKDLMDDDPSKGSDNAPVIVVEFSDFQCPFCGRFYSQTLLQIKEEYIDTGKVQFVYRDFPISSIHSQAKPAAMAAECADEQGKFWEYHNKIFENQANLGEENLKKWAEEIELNTKTFNSCFDSQKYGSEVDKDFSSGSSLGASGTPTFFIGKRDGNPQKVVGAQPFSVFKQVIDSLLQ